MTITADQFLAAFDAHTTEIHYSGLGKHGRGQYEGSCSCGWVTPWPSGRDVTYRYTSHHRQTAIGY